MPSSPYLRDVLHFEHALLRAALYGERTTVQWDIDPTELFDALEQGRVPDTVRPLKLAMEIATR